MPGIINVQETQVLNQGIRESVRTFEQLVRVAGVRASRQAESRSRKRFKSKLVDPPRKTIPPRPTGTRPTTQGTFGSHIQWESVDGGSGVRANIEHLDRVAPYWLIQEVGTKRGMSARGLEASPTGPIERIVAGVPSQAGRTIPSGLVWSGNNPRTDQIVKGPWKRPIEIRKEIEAKNFLQRGARSGLTTYRNELEKAFLNAFGHHPKP